MFRRLCTFLSVLVLGLVFSPLFAHAGSEHNVAGWIWSSNIGWISLNSITDGSSVDYGVNLNADGTLTGYAWSSNIGWIQFGGLASFPTGSGTISSNAKLVGTVLQGWVKAISADNNGWDGWISLSGSGYGVSLANNQFSGYAWGSDVIGWIMFDVQNSVPTVCTNCGASLTSSATLDIKSGGSSLSGQSAVAYGTIPTYYWTLTNPQPGTTCSLYKSSTGGTSFTTVNGITATGNTTGNALTDASYTFKLDCSNGGTLVSSSAISFTVAPQPPGFSIGQNDTARIQFLAAGSADSEVKTIYVNPVGGYSSPVTIQITGYPSAPSGTTFTYSLNGGAFTATPGPVTVSSTNGQYPGVTFQMRISNKVTVPYTVTLTGTGSGVSSASESIVVSPVFYNPSFKEF